MRLGAQTWGQVQGQAAHRHLLAECDRHPHIRVAAGLGRGGRYGKAGDGDGLSRASEREGRHWESCREKRDECKRPSTHCRQLRDGLIPAQAGSTLEMSPVFEALGFPSTPLLPRRGFVEDTWKIGARRQIELAVRIAQMALDGLLSHEERLGDLPVAESASCHAANAKLARR
jgi:hypothetical protein